MTRRKAMKLVRKRLGSNQLKRFKSQLRRTQSIINHHFFKAGKNRGGPLSFRCLQAELESAILGKDWWEITRTLLTPNSVEYGYDPFMTEFLLRKKKKKTKK